RRGAVLQAARTMTLHCSPPRSPRFDRGRGPDRGRPRRSLALALAVAVAPALAVPLGCTARGQAAEPGPNEAAEATAPAEARPAAKPPEAQATWVETAVVAPTDAALEPALAGEAAGFRGAALASSQGGFIESVHAQVGDEVRKGQLLAKVDTALYKARQGQAGAELGAAKRELARVQKIEKIIAQAELDQART